VSTAVEVANLGENYSNGCILCF